MLLAENSFSKQQPSKYYGQAVSLNAQGVIYHLKGNHIKAIESFKKSLEFVRDYTEARKNLIIALCRQSRFQDALNFLSGNKSDGKYQDKNLEAIILLRLQKPEEALAILQSIPRHLFLAVDTITSVGKALSLLGHHQAS